MDRGITRLLSVTAIDGLDVGTDDARAEAVGAAIVALAVPLGGDSAFDAALTKVWDVTRPETGRSARTADGAWVAGLQADQLWFLRPDTTAGHDVDDVPDAVAHAAYLTDQSDAWVAVRIEGPRVREALARLCMLDLTDSPFPVGAVTRTLMEHMGVVILREDDANGHARFLLLAPRSYAGSFVHAVETAITNAASRHES